MDNRVFNINGSGQDMLTEVLSLAFRQSGMRNAEASVFDPDKGLILLWSASELGANKFPIPLSPKIVSPIVFRWLQSDTAKSMKLDDWDEDAGHDGHNTYGWRVYCERWGHVGKWDAAIVAITPAFMWHGK